LTWTWQQDPYLEYYYFFEIEKLNGVFTDFPKTLYRYFSVARPYYLENGMPAAPQDVVVNLTPFTGEKKPLNESRPFNIAHRGACGVLPEHTLEAYQLAIDQGADFIECDVVLTKDLVPICRHEPNLIDTTNVELLFPELKTTYVIDGVETEGIFSTDMTLEQIKTLTAN